MLEQVKRALLNYADVDPSAITADTDLIRDLKLNSYDFVAMIGEFEDSYGIEIPEDKLLEMHTVGDIAKYLSDNT